MKTTLLLLSLSVLSACATNSSAPQRSLYGPLSPTGGYSEADIGNGAKVVRFAGNANTAVGDASGFSLFRAVEICKGQGFKVANIIGQFNQSTSKTSQVTSTAGYQAPTYYTGTSLGGIQAAGGATRGTSVTENVDSVYPTFDVAFICSNVVYRAGLDTKDIAAEDMKSLVKDLIGGVQISSFAPDSPNSGVLNVGDIITKVGDIRVKNGLDFVAALQSKANKNAVQLTVFNEGEMKKVKAHVEDKIEEVSKQNDELIRGGCVVPEIKASSPLCSR